MEMVQNGQNGREFKLAQKWMQLGGDVPPHILKIWSKIIITTRVINVLSHVTI